MALVVGTRPEAIKLAPVAHALAGMGEWPRLFITGQHPGLELNQHGLQDFDALPLSCPGQTDPMLHAELVRSALRRVLRLDPPDLVLVQGDTSSALGGAQAAHAEKIPLGHVEAGLRSFDLHQPWPEEGNRVAIDHLSDLLFAPTDGNARNLAEEHVDGSIFVTGNSGIDSLAAVTGILPVERRRNWIPRRGFRLLATCHRRESWGEGLAQIASALREIADMGVTVDLLLHPNPAVTEAMWRLLGDKTSIRLVAPLSHPAMIRAMLDADLILSDSGGMQEEAPALGIPLLVMRGRTERPEGIAAGSSLLVGTDRDRIVAEVSRLRSDRAGLAAMAMPSLPFGDGRSGPRIATICMDFLKDVDGLSSAATRRA
ncbi:non-hydrolyzing UDP-N-acetylglucosamine 2-epimerase [Sphingomonas sp. LY160]|uniref:non-hydrolyzing UDP-N-acetylglucosamine 2-epimerase n=1 Tax=Sphingomonas sp. LY160 TaxID=3095342 RepID=UPI002ADEEDAC|nr:UDP-N-acetylglucosamine 2-epimerase (non-hydrolyzing) [Sphingomonas sp. LY160]MEA1071793.1 UDP-N-acetylglucosamine 2-epimerase (non-hydrolyzing) [Sphingomonas sp. LY160]